MVERRGFMVTVDAWSPDLARLEECLAQACVLSMGRAAYEVAIVREPERPITLRDGIRLVAASEAYRQAEARIEAERPPDPPLEPYRWPKGASRGRYRPR